jgi:PAS domain S-box-containing protein
VAAGDLPRLLSLLQATLDSSADGILAVDLEGTTIAYNRRFAEMWGMPEAVIRRRDERVAFARRLIKEPEPYLARIDAIYASADAESTDVIELRDGRVFERHTKPQYLDGVVVGRVASFRDVTERRRTEEALRDALAWREAVVEGSRDAIFMSDSSARFVAVNQAACELTGYPREALLEMRIPDLHDDADLDAHRRYYSRILGGEEVVSEARIRHRNGTRVDVEFNSRRVAIGGAWYVHTVARDVTARKRAEERLRQSRQLLRQLAQRVRDAQEEERTRISRELHDQVGQALTAIKMHLEASGRGAAARSPDAQAEAIHLVEQALQQIRTLSFDLRPALLDDLGLAAALGSYARRQAEAAGLKLHLSAKPLAQRPPREVETACFRIGQEAITNVVRHARARRLDVTLRRQEGVLELRVEDDGAGFAADGPPQETWGLGLLAMEERAVAAGGALEVQSRAGRGTTVRAYFPLFVTSTDH